MPNPSSFAAPPVNDTYPVLSGEAMQKADSHTIESLGIPSFTLMESAGRESARLILERYGPPENLHVGIFCGKGNNGGDGLVIARQLLAFGAQVDVLTLAEAAEMSDDAARNVTLLHQRLDEADGNGRIVQFESESDLHAFTSADLFVDALLGTGLTSELREPIRSLVDWLNRQPQPIVGIDIPTGLHSDTGEVLGSAVKCHFTITMAALKAGLLFGDASEFTGELDVVEIGIPGNVLQSATLRPDCGLLSTDPFVKQHLPSRAPDAYKYSVGFALIVAGSPGMTGAPVMAAQAAARAGAGYVSCASAGEALKVVESHLTEITTIELPSSADGIDPDGGLQAVKERLEKASGLLVGPGLGRASGTQKFVRQLLTQTGTSAVIDADGLNALSGSWLEEHGRPKWVLTPHAGEFSRLADDDVDLDHRIETATTYADRWNCTLLLKGMPSIVATPDGNCYIGATGNAGLATAGTGDVLAGICCGLIAQGVEPQLAAISALHLGGCAAEHFAEEQDLRTMVATDVIRNLPVVLKQRFS